MKLHNLLFVAALVLSAGITFVVAEEPVDEDIRKETIYSYVGSSGEDKNTYAKYPSFEEGNNTLPVTLFQYAGIAGTKNEWNYSVDRDENDVADEDGEEFHVYDFTVPFDDSATEKLGFTALDDSDNNPVSSSMNVGESGDSRSSDKGTPQILSFDKDLFNNVLNKAKIMSGNSYLDELKEKEDFSSPLTVPFAMLCLLLGLGIIMVIHTVVSEKKSKI